MPANGRWDLIRRLKVKQRHNERFRCQATFMAKFATVFAHSRSTVVLLTLYDWPFPFSPTEDEGKNTHVPEFVC